METFKVIEIKKSIYDENQKDADELRKELLDNDVMLINVMSSPGSGKTTALTSTINHLKAEFEIGVLEADIDSDVDAVTIAKTGAKVIQLHTGGMCHLDASMTRQGLEALGFENLDIAILENIGNLICTAGYDTGASKNVMILSVPEGDDKPLKYPPMFAMADVLLISKIDVLEHFDFDMDACKTRAKNLNPNIEIFPISAKTGEGIEPWVEWLKTETLKIQGGN
ncbi:MAG TPA: hydrogenase nickel incorporation protein HypB [Erysipelotrichaceae bacterium]|nr:hydrogenase nickel incorporation protein HypB [Erysipelotrichaceae bacterium]